MNILIASNYLELTDAIEAELAQSGIKADLTPIETVDDLVSTLVTDRYHYIISEYSLNGTDIWRLAKLINSSQLVSHAIPIYLIKDSCEMEIPMLLAKAHDFKVVACHHLGDTLKEDHNHNLATGYRRGRRSTEKPTLLIVDDDVDAAVLIDYNLRNEFACDVAQTGEMGLALWEQKRHELVLLDYMLPGIKGDVVLEKMMAIDPYQPVIVMTAYDHQERN